MSVASTVPGLPPGDYYLIMCWDSHSPAGGPVTYWQMGNVDHLFTINPATSSPTPTPSPTPSPTPTPTPTPTPHPTPPPTTTPTVTPTPHSFAVNHFAYSQLPPIDYLAPFLLTEDLSIFGIEVTEGMQCFDPAHGLSGCPDNSLSLVTQKDATARIYLKYSGPTTSKAGIPVRVHLFANGVEYIVNASGTAHKTLNQADADTPNVWFNVNFTNDVDVSFYAEVDPNNIYSEFDESNNRYPASGTITVHFSKRRTFNVEGWRMHYHPSGAVDSGYAGGWAVNTGGPNWLNLVWPVKNGGIHYSIHSGYLDWTSVIGAGGEGAVVSYTKTLALLESIFPWLGIDPELFGQDRVHVWTPSSHFVRGLSDPPWGPGLGVASVGTDSFNGGMSIDSPGFGPINFVHEVSHNSGEYHTSTGLGCDTSGGGTDWPYSDATIQEFGFNPDTGVVYDPSSTYDYMSYCYGGGATSWISPFHWNQQFGVEGAAVGSVQPQAVPTSAVLGVTATLDNPDLNGDTGGALGTLYKTDGGGNPGTPPPGTGYSIQLRNGDQVLATQPFGVSFVPIETDGTAAQGPAATLPSVSVSFAMPWPDGTTSVVLLRGAQVLDTVSVSAHAPTVHVNSPSQHETWAAGSTHTINWTGSDADGNALRYTVFFSHNGLTWEVLASDLTGTSYDVVVDSVAGGDHTMFRVVASDGVNTGYGDSPTIAIPNKAPFVAITGPQDGAVVQAGALVVLDGAATDLEDGPLTDGSLTWSSDKDGLLGTGESLPINTLSPGQHKITLTAKDSNGASASQSITLVVGVRGNLQVLPSSVDPAGTGNVTAIITLPPGIQTTDINTSSLHVHIGTADLTPLASVQLGDTNQDGLPELKLTLDGQATRAALAAPHAQALGAPHSQVEVDLTGSMNGGSALAASGKAALITPGDVNCSGATDAADVTAALAYKANLRSPDCLFAGDLNCDGDVTVLDVLGILGHIAGVAIPAASCPIPSLTTAGLALSASPALGHESGFGFAPGGFGSVAWLAPAFVTPALVIVRRRR